MEHKEQGPKRFQTTYVRILGASLVVVVTEIVFFVPVFLAGIVQGKRGVSLSLSPFAALPRERGESGKRGKGMRGGREKKCGPGINGEF